MAEPERLQVTICRNVACCINKATRAQVHARARTPTDIQKHTHALAHVHTEILLFYGNSGFVNAPLCYVLRTLLVLLKF
jgi:hypothetical protein